jgi:predicted nicotinamide N-methyase
MFENDSKSEEVECWNLPKDFDLFAKHEVGKVYYPTKEDSSKSTHAFQIECIEPDSPLDILNRSESSSQYDATGHCVWAGAFLLIQCIHELEQNSIAKKRIIEFGCGTGIGGLAMMLHHVADDNSMPSMMCFTDNDPDALNVCKRNCELNNLSQALYSIKELTWGEETNPIVNDSLFDIALATDVLYDVDLIDPLFTSVSKYVSLNGIFILSHIPRACYNENNPIEAVENLEKYIIDQATNYGLQLDAIIRPPGEHELQEELLEWIPRTAFSGGAVLIFRRS